MQLDMLSVTNSLLILKLRIIQNSTRRNNCFTKTLEQDMVLTFANTIHTIESIQSFVEKVMKFCQQHKFIQVLPEAGYTTK